ncbi:WhiB family transcriptional regulator [Bifidobacterium longum subsp. longum]|uniref:WhiB family transcriptional regulator n=2 Tax=Bifidobacterium longum TaxID=216816 RepID=A0A7L9UHR4_BIFLL|nr:WhiB family transcriptional regulator [Bifidobacterium longum]QOL54517.1 WhiB family transcriptional regulator [Bifidobacterium longum subsp. longum]
MSGWRDKAACRDMDPDLFFPTTSSEERLALKACAQCPAICECARYAAEHALINGYPLQGIWGGINRSKGKNYRNNEKEMWE